MLSNAIQHKEVYQDLNLESQVQGHNTGAGSKFSFSIKINCGVPCNKCKRIEAAFCFDLRVQFSQTCLYGTDIFWWNGVANKSLVVFMLHFTYRLRGRNRMFWKQHFIPKVLV